MKIEKFIYQMCEEPILKKMEYFVVLWKQPMSKKFRATLCGDVDYEEMVADLYYDMRPVAMVRQEDSIYNMEIEEAKTEKNAIGSLY